MDLLCCSVATRAAFAPHAGAERIGGDALQHAIGGVEQELDVREHEKRRRRLGERDDLACLEPEQRAGMDGWASQWRDGGRHKRKQLDGKRAGA